MGQRQHMDGGADLDALRARGDLAGDVHRRAQHRAARLLMDLGEPKHIEAPFVRRLDLLEPLRERIGVGLPRHLPVKLVIPAELHGSVLVSAPVAGCSFATLGRAPSSNKYCSLIRPIP